MQSEKPIAEEIIEHYAGYDESQRLTDGFGSLERERTKALVKRYLPPPPANILDVGGATGAYTFWLAGLGHHVHLVDIVPRHIDQARQRSQASNVPELASIRVGDARTLEFPDTCADVVMMHGPLYHLTTRDDRLQALREAKRVLRPGGVLLAFAITRYAGVTYGITQGYVFDPEYLAMTKREVKTGQRRDPPDWLHTFPQAHFHHPDELKDELTEVGLVHEATLGVIGPAWLVPDLDESWQDAEKRQYILAVAQMLEHESVLGPRLMAVARKEGGSEKGEG
jgi:ubiquinone/menaquinone biosynthesis C-methylase UbiE